MFGTPTDCVIRGARHLLNGHDPDLVLSGVNRDRNVGEDVIYSGTIAGAMEGTVLSIPSLSQTYKSRSGQSARVRACTLALRLSARCP